VCASARTNSRSSSTAPGARGGLEQPADQAVNGTTIYIARYDENWEEETLSGFCLLFAALSRMLKA
jgi:hypothetical protein